jgi:hypothetical protein
VEIERKPFVGARRYQRRSQMTLANAVYALEELAQGRIPDHRRALLGLNALDPLLLEPGREAELDDAAAALELVIAVETLAVSTDARTRAVEMAAAVRRLIPRD